MEKFSVFPEVTSKLLRDCKYTMPVGAINHFKRHSISSVFGIFGATSIAKSAFTSKRNNFKITAMFTAINCKAFAHITARKHFINFFSNYIANIWVSR